MLGTIVSHAKHILYMTRMVETFDNLANISLKSKKKYIYPQRKLLLLKGGNQERNSFFELEV